MAASSASHKPQVYFHYAVYFSLQDTTKGSTELVDGMI
jgi:hypothetical protein